MSMLKVIRPEELLAVEAALAAAQLEVKLLTAQRDQLLLKVENLKVALGGVRESMKKNVDLCCGESVGKQFCETYGCGTLAGYINDIDALLATPDVPEEP